MYTYILNPHAEKLTGAPPAKQSPAWSEGANTQGEWAYEYVRDLRRNVPGRMLLKKNIKTMCSKMKYITFRLLMDRYIFHFMLTWTM